MINDEEVMINDIDQIMISVDNDVHDKAIW